MGKNKLVALVLMLVSLLALVACGKDAETKVDYSTLSEENIKNSLADSKSRNRIEFKKIEIKDNEVKLNGETTSDYTVKRDDLDKIIIDTFEQLNNFKDIKYVTINLSTTTTDKYGESSKTKVFSGGIKGDDLRKINYKESYNVQLDEIMDVGYVHPVIK